MKNLRLIELANRLSNESNLRTVAKMELEPEQIEKNIAYFKKLAIEKPIEQTLFSEYEYNDTKRVLWQKFVEKGFIVTPENKDTLIALCRWLNGSKNEVTDKYKINPKKGIFLCGGTGNGKTTLMRCLQQIGNQNPYYKFRGFKMQNTSEFLAELAKGYIPTSNDYKGSWFFDDIGTGYVDIKKVYGNGFHPLPYLIDLMYNNFLKGYPVHITSNLTPVEILFINPDAPKGEQIFRDGFDERIRGRMNEMFNFVYNFDKDYRF